ncbi:hypothetical protein amrb99_42420 [Actinomadura sp. RB99]|uniref:hypothetical protein n=1 Tax=Actinomadura sp. RB99 TaxID=2691577 RepID=UPI0019B7EFEE|nr:hypothetical protein [Actinomadura sp. RB99]MBD2895308.1 hypothetical protein [Actinomadura sp. RB99]
MRTGFSAAEVPAGVRAAWAVFDLAAGCAVAERWPAEVFRAASVVKVLMALDFLRGRVVEARDREMVGAMLRASDDAAADEVWERGGRAGIVERMVRRAGLRETVPPPAGMPGWWGYTGMSAGDVVRVYRHAVAVPEGRFVLEQLGRMAKRGADGFDQVFGIAEAGPSAVKQGWSGFEDVPDRRPAPAELGLGRPALHTTGVVDGKIVVVLTLHPEGTSAEAAAGCVTALARAVMQVTCVGRGSSPDGQ